MKNSEKAWIYVLKCPETRAIRYVGMTRDWVRRMAQHQKPPISPKSPLGEWLLGLASAHKIPLFEIALEIDLNTTSGLGWVYWDLGTLARKLEDDLISRCLERGCRLFNRPKYGTQPA